MEKNLSATTITVTPQPSSAAASGAEVTLLRNKVEVLTEENLSLKREVASLKKRVAASAAAGAPPSKKARTPGQKKKLFEKWANALTRESRKHKVHYDMCAPDAYTIAVKDTGVWTPAEFHDLFDGHGVKIQPTPENKPKAVVTILRFYGFEDVERFFAYVGGAEIAETGYEVQLWRKRRFGGCYQYDTAEARMNEMEVHYNKSRQTLQIVFELVYGGLLEKSDAKSEPESEGLYD